MDGDSMSPSLTLCFWIGCLVWPLLFVILWLSLSKIYTDVAMACGTAMRLVAIAHAVTLTASGIHVMSVTYRDMFYHDCYLLDQSLAFTGIYWPYDVIALYLTYQREKPQGESPPFFHNLKMFLRDHRLIVFHHIIVVLFGYPLVLHYRRGRGAFLISCALLSEFSSPFVILRKLLLKHGFMDSWMFIVNNILIAVTFFWVRVFLYPAIYLFYGYSQGLSPMEVVRSMYFGCHVGMVVIVVLQTVWYVKFLQGAFPHLLSSQLSLNGASHQPRLETTAPPKIAQQNGTKKD
ncbi:TLC domain-containing protein 3A-like [Diadema setosum]|uniref:TLC domain-containing protein 3A-like n=1 Tax=Diadema setosum TaxID=31175 RepID=UPI003B3AA75C